jgi:hypothetical protein
MNENRGTKIIIMAKYNQSITINNTSYRLVRFRAFLIYLAIKKKKLLI